MLNALYQYLTFILYYHDYRNDWLTHMPKCVRPVVQALGHVLALALASGDPHARHYAATAIAGMRHCADPAMPTPYTSAMLAAAHVLARLYDLLITLGYC